MANSRVSMKLLIDTRGRRVIFAEAGKDCIDFLFHLLSLPVATVIRLIGEGGMEGSLPTLYKSLEHLDETYLQSNQKKDNYLKPAVRGYGTPFSLLGLRTPSPPSQNYSSGSGYSSLQFGFRPSSRNDNGGLVKGVVTYMVMDDLEVKPLSTFSAITLLNDSNVRFLGALEEKVVSFGMPEAIKLLEISLKSKRVLTELFCSVEEFPAAIIRRF